MANEIFAHRFYRTRDDGSSTRLSMKLLWEPRDMWIGVYWTRVFDHLCDRKFDHLFVYICLLPMLPIRLHWTRSRGGRFI